MKKIATAFSLYWHFVLDILLTHIYVIAFLYLDFPFIAALLMSVDSLLKFLSAMFVSSRIARIDKALRYKISALIRFILIIVWFLAVIQFPIKTVLFYVFIPYLVFKILIIIDSLLSADLIFLSMKNSILI